MRGAQERCSDLPLQDAYARLVFDELLHLIRGLVVDGLVEDLGVSLQEAAVLQNTAVSGQSEQDGMALVLLINGDFLVLAAQLP